MKQFKMKEMNNDTYIKGKKYIVRSKEGFSDNLIMIKVLSETLKTYLIKNIDNDTQKRYLKERFHRQFKLIEELKEENLSNSTDYLTVFADMYLKK